VFFIFVLFGYYKLVASLGIKTSFWEKARITYPDYRKERCPLLADSRHVR
jgi:hypothetical protein